MPLTGQAKTDYQREYMHKRRSNTNESRRMRNFHIDFSVKQSKAYDYWMQNDIALELLYGGAKYGGKSYGGCLLVYLEAVRLAKEHVKKRPAYPIPVGFMGRKVGKDFYDTTFESWKKAIPGDCYRLKGQPVEIIIEERVKILTGGLDNRETVNKFNSAELAFYFLDQAEETLKDDISLLRTATFWRLSLGGVKIPGKGLLTANPAQCWLKQEFIDTTEVPEHLPQTVGMPDVRHFVNNGMLENPYGVEEYRKLLRELAVSIPRLKYLVTGKWEDYKRATSLKFSLTQKSRSL